MFCTVFVSTTILSFSNPTLPIFPSPHHGCIRCAYTIYCVCMVCARVRCIYIFICFGREIWHHAIGKNLLNDNLTQEEEKKHT